MTTCFTCPDFVPFLGIGCGVAGRCAVTGETIAKAPRLLDLFCGAGGAGEGYSRAGFDVTGVDIKPQKHNPHTFVQADALEYPREHGREFDLIHASPPCQAHTALRALHKDREYMDLIEPMRKLLQEIGRPYVIENVPGAPLKNPVLLCGSMFGLGTGDAELRRHRLFELGGWSLTLTPRCQHGLKPATISVHGHGTGISLARRNRVIGVYGGHGRDRRRISNTQNFTTDQRREAMGIDWMTGAELSQAIPLAYTEFLARAWLTQNRKADPCWYRDANKPCELRRNDRAGNNGTAPSLESPVPSFVGR